MFIHNLDLLKYIFLKQANFLFIQKSSMTAQESKNRVRRIQLENISFSTTNLRENCTLNTQTAPSRHCKEGCFDLRLEVTTGSPPFIIVTIRHYRTLCYRKHDVSRFTPVIFGKTLYYRIEIEIFSILHTKFFKVNFQLLGPIKIATNPC